MESQVLFVENLPSDITETELYDTFICYGNILEIRIGNNDSTLGTAYIIFSDQKHAIKAQNQINGTLIRENYIRVTFFDVVKKLLEYEKNKRKQFIRNVKLDLNK